MNIRNIIFDLGGVIIDIDYLRTINEFNKLGAFNFDTVYSQSKQDKLFDEFDTGKIDSNEFRVKLSEKAGINISNEEFDYAWNAMLLDLPMERLNFIRSLRNDYSVFLFSNTNDIHLKEVLRICEEQNGINTLEPFFNKTYYSNIFGLRKPNKDSFIAILNENNLTASETLFIDDSLQHILGAQEAGLQTFHLTNDKTIFDVGDYLQREKPRLSPVI